MRDLKACCSQICEVGSKLPSLDYAGHLFTLVGSNATKAGIPYTCLVRSRVPYFNAYVPLGTLGLAQAVLSCIDWRPARFLIGAGAVGSMLELCGLKASGNVHYVGLESLTALPVRGIVGEAVVIELLRRVKERKDIELSGRDSERRTYVVWAKINEPDKIEGEVHVKGEEGALLNYFAGIMNIIVLVLMGKCHEWFGFSLVIVGMFLNIMIGYLLQAQKFVLPTSSPARGVPKGDAVIQLNDDPDVFCVLGGTEKAIQILLQKEIVLEAGWVERWPLFLVAVACQVYSMVVMLGVPHMKSSSQWMWALVVCVGAMIDLTKGSWNARRGLGEEAIVKYDIEVLSAKKFGNRTASVASIAAGNTKLDTLKAAQLVPTAGPVWQSWWTVLGDVLDDEAIEENEVKKKELEDKISAKMKTSEDIALWKTLQADMFQGLNSGASLRQRKNVGNLSRIDPEGVP